MPFTLTDIEERTGDIDPRFAGATDLEFRAATKALGLEQSALSYQRVPLGSRFPYGHAREVRGGVRGLRWSGRMNVDDEVAEVEEWDAVRVPRPVYDPARAHPTRRV